MGRQRGVSTRRSCQLALLIALVACPALVAGTSQDPGSAPSAEQAGPNQQAPARAVPPPDGRMILPGYSISGRVLSVGTGCTPTGRQVVVRLSRGGREVGSRNLVLDATGAASFRFELGSHASVPGGYTLRAEKGAPNPEAYTCTMNICLDRIDPVSRSVTLSAASRNATNQDFSISWVAAFDRAGWCW